MTTNMSLSLCFTAVGFLQLKTEVTELFLVITYRLPEQYFLQASKASTVNHLYKNIEDRKQK